MFSVLRIRPAFPAWLCVLHSQQQCLRVPATQHPRRHLIAPGVRCVSWLWLVCLFFSNDEWSRASFHVCTWHSYILLGELSINVFCAFNTLVIFDCWVLRVHYIFQIKVLCQTCDLQIFPSRSVACLFVLLMAPFTEQKFLFWRKHVIIFFHGLCFQWHFWEVFA